MTESQVDLMYKAVPGSRDIDLVDVFGFFRENLAVLLFSIFLGVLVGLAVFAYLPYKWSANITLQIGKIPILQNFDYIDPPTEVAEKIKSPLFLKKIGTLVYHRQVDPDSLVGQLLYKDLKSSVVKGRNQETVQVFGRSPDEAYNNAGVLARTVVDEYQAMAEPYLKQTKKRLADVTANIERNRNVLKNLDSIEQGSPSRNEANALLKLTLLDAKSDEIQKLQTEQTRLELLLTAANMQQTKVVGRSLMPRKPASPSRAILIVGGAFFGLVLGFLVSLALSVRRRSNDSARVL